MKKQTVNNIAKRVFLGSIVSVVIFLSAQNKAIAGNNFRSDSAINVNNPEKVSVKYIGSSADGVFFNVKYNNVKGETFDIVITDESGETLYRGSFNDKFFDKKFLLPEDNESSSISIALKSEKEKFAQSYNVNISTSTVKDVVVSQN
jgi:hypothetical protein